MNAKKKICSKRYNLLKIVPAQFRPSTRPKLRTDSGRPKVNFNKQFNGECFKRLDHFRVKILLIVVCKMI